MKAVLVNYNFDPKDWWLEYGFKPEDVTIYDRSDDGIERTFAAKTYKTKNIGDVDYDKLGYLIENYYDLPDVFLWGKTNLFKYVDKEFLQKALENQEFKPLLKLDHKTYSDRFGEVCKYQGEIYLERADSWFFNNDALAKKFCKSWEEWRFHFFLPNTPYIPFAPGGNYILTKDRIQRYAPEYYEGMRDTLPYATHPAEAHACERSYYILWK